jgi:hypothetical protein
MMKEAWSYRQGIYVFLAVVGGQSAAAVIIPYLNNEPVRQFSAGMFFAVSLLGAILLASKAFIWMNKIDMRNKDPLEKT